MSNSKRQNTRVLIRLPESLLAASRKRAESRGLDYSGYVRTLLARDCGIDEAEVARLPVGLAAVRPATRKKLAAQARKARKKT